MQYCMHVSRSQGEAVMQARVFDYLRRHRFKKVQLVNDTDSGLRAVIAIHSTALGPATGGLRMWTYPDESSAIFDALRLARGMTYKYAAAGVDLGGGKAVEVYLSGGDDGVRRLSLDLVARHVQRVR